MMEAWTFIDGMKVSVPLDRCDAVKYGWHLGTNIDMRSDIERERAVRQWCRQTFAQNCYKEFCDSVWFYREEDAVLCQLRWA